MRRVVVTGIGLITPLGAGREISWKRLIAGQSGAGPITHFKVDDLPCRIACHIPRTDGRGGHASSGEGVFDPDKAMSPKEQRRVDEFILYAMAAAAEAGAGSGPGSARPSGPTP